MLSRNWGDYERAIRMLGQIFSLFVPELRVLMQDGKVGITNSGEAVPR